MRHYGGRLFIAATLFLTVIHSGVQAASLYESVNGILHDDPDILDTIYQRDINYRELDAVRAEYLPTVDLSMGTGSETITQTPAVSFDEKSVPRTDLSLSLKLNIFKGFESLHKFRKQKHRLRASGFKLDEQKELVALDVTEAYINVLKDRANLRFSRQSIAHHEHIYNQIKEKVDAGFARRSELEQVLGRLSMVKTNHIILENNFIQSLIILEGMLGEKVDPDTLTTPEHAVTLPASLRVAADAAFGNHPSLKVARINIDAGQSDYRAQLSEYYPSVDLELTRANNENVGGIEMETESTSAMVMLNYNLFNGLASRTRIQEKKIEVLRMENEQRRVERDLFERLSLAWTAHVFLKDQIKELEEHRYYANATYEAYQKEFNLGRRDLLDLLNAQNEQNDAEKRLSAAKFDNLFSQYRILEGMGLLVEHFEQYRTPGGLQKKPLSGQEARLKEVMGDIEERLDTLYRDKTPEKAKPQTETKEKEGLMEDLSDEEAKLLEMMDEGN